MIRSFLDSWSLFQDTYLAGWLIGLVLSLVGVLVVAKDQIFIGAAVSQASALGMALAMSAAGILGGTAAQWLDSDSALSMMAVLFSIAAALVTSFANRSRESHEAVTGWIFLVSASVSVLVLSHSPHGLEEVHRLISSSIIGATRGDVLLFALLLAASILLIVLRSRLILLLVMDLATARALGVRTAWWSIGLALWLGLSIGLSIRIAGMLYTFGFLVLPALVAKNICREVRSMFLIAPVVALATGITAFVLSNYWDFPPGQMSVALLSALLPLAWLAGSFRAR